jgi:hypothetical protein
MKKLLFATAMLAAFVGHANAAAEMPEFLTGQWCQTAVKTNQYGESGDYIKAKNLCKETRPVIFDIHQVGFWIKLASVKTRIMCVPLKVEIFAHGWSVVADCGAEDLSTAVYRSGFTFESWPQWPKGTVAISRWIPQGGRDY